MRVQQESGEERNDLLPVSLLHNTFVDPAKHSDLIGRTWAESKKLWRIAGPSIFSRLAMFSVTTITQSLAGHLSDTDLAAISIVTTVLIGLTFGFLLGMASALETHCGQAYGAKRYAVMGIHAQRSCVVLTFCAVLLLPMFALAAPIARLAGQSEDVAARTGIAAIWLVPFHLSLPFQFSLQRFLQSQVKAGAVAVISALVLLVHVVVSWLFVYRLRVGIVGAALTIDLAWWLSAFGMFGYVVLGGCPETWTGFSTEAFSDLWEFFKLSLASGVMLSLENFYYRMLIIVTGFFQNAHIAVDALSICISIYGWESMIPLGFLGSIGVRVANELGAGNAKAAKFATTVSIITSLSTGLLFAMIIILFNEKLALIFTSSLPVVEMVNDFSVMLSLTIVVNSIAPVLAGVAVGSGWQATAAFVNMGSYYVIGLPLGICFGSFLSFGIKGIWAGMICGTIVQTLALTFITVRCEWEKEVEKVQMSLTNQEPINSR